MADKIPTGRTGESKSKSPVTFKKGSQVIYEGAVSQYLGDPIHEDPAGIKRVSSRKRRGGGGGGW